MKQLLIELDAETAAKLEKIAPARSRRRSEFIRHAIRRALWDVEEQATRAAYVRQPDAAADDSFDAEVWDPPTTSKRRARRRR